MMHKTLPTFKYHPDPVSTGAFEPLDEICDCCGEKSHYIYSAPINAIEDIDALCPWCIANGKAHKKFDADFTSNVAVANTDEVAPWCSIPEEIENEIAYRTPGFAGYQEEHWWSHCNDGAVFLGYLGDLDKDLFAQPEAKNFVSEMKKLFEIDDKEWEWLVSTPDKEHAITFFVFKCLHCGEIGGYGDFS